MESLDLPDDVKEILTSEQKVLLIERRKQPAENREHQSGPDCQASTRVAGANHQDDTDCGVLSSRIPDSPDDFSAIEVYSHTGRPPGQDLYHSLPPPQTPSSRPPQRQQQEPSQQLQKRKHQPQYWPQPPQQSYVFHQHGPQQPPQQQGHRPPQPHQHSQRFLNQQNPRSFPAKASYDRGHATAAQRGSSTSTAMLNYESHQSLPCPVSYDSEPNLDNRFYTADQRLVLPRKGYPSGTSNRVDEASPSTKMDEPPLPRVQESGDKRTLSYWEQRGLPTDGILLNKKMFLCGLTPDRVLFKYFTKVQGSLVPDRPMDRKMQENMEALYEKIFEKPLNLLDGKVSMKFGRAFIAQELKKKKFNWAQYAMSEYVRITDRNAKKALALRKRQSKPVVESDLDAEGDGDWDVEVDGDGDGDGDWDGEGDGEGGSGEGYDADEMKLDSQYQISGQAEEAELGESNYHHSRLPYTVTTLPDTQMDPHIRGKLDEDIQKLRLELQKALILTECKDEMVSQFDRCVMPYLSESSKMEQEKADLRQALVLAENKCTLLEADLYCVKGKQDMESMSVQAGIQSLKALVAKKPFESADPERLESNLAATKKWIQELKEGCMHVGYSKHGLQEQEKAYDKLAAEHAVASAERIALTKKLNQRMTSRSTGDTEDGSNKRLKI